MNVPSNENSAPISDLPKDSTAKPQTDTQHGWLERYFKLAAHNTTASTEVIAGITTFMTMVYIVFVNPQILSAAGMDPSGVFVVTCMISAIGCIAMGLIANLPIALLPPWDSMLFFRLFCCRRHGYQLADRDGHHFLGSCLLCPDVRTRYPFLDFKQHPKLPADRYS